ncbi:hydroxyacylglutathione hydrolase [Cellvibrio zantedeschiae]|uniref:Hydroxyacylglutathione hydrolase n=1 Tax=Cellvibrio zantedeschiae TaxID=1237077 RepID=A0ABQ3AY61_9GAMM|nr:hydroxyacylglutathione hydrolase [Cellvibrio zantedeschiae]GGY71490.1 hydroxyacylglutathione hydrolase [Cellvibrio zantedeschiae]
MLHIHTIPAFTDNYFWLLQPDIGSPDTYIVDPGAAQPVYDYLTKHKLTLQGILLTHHHHDHIDGAAELAESFKILIYGPDSKRIPQVTQHLYEGNRLQLGNISAEIMEIPGHTLDHIAYLINTPDSSPLLFSGDTLFAVGCGRLFDGTAPLLHQALQRIAALPDDTLVFCGHEYTLANIRFALTIEPDNTDLKSRQEIEIQKRERGVPTLPTLLDLERRTNPFLRCHLNSVRTSVERLSNQTLTTDAEIFASLRLLKDRF